MAPGDAAAAAGGDDPIESLLAQCLERVERDGEAAVDEICARHPEHAATLRRELEVLRALGLLGDAAPGPEEPALERIGDFRLLRKLGQGGMGVVYLAEQTSLRRLVALKVLRGGADPRSGAAARFQREAQTVARLRHPGIVTLYGAGEEGELRWLAMELVPGRGLDEALAAAGRAPLPIPSVVRWGVELARALACAHAAGVVHRDVKPSNVRLTADGRALLLDFGLARDLSEPGLTRTGEFQGSPHYASPEQVGGGRAPIGPRSDVYSLGVTLYECATGRVPFPGETTEQVFHGILAREPLLPRRRNPAVPRDLETVILKALEKDPERRYASADALAQDLESILELRPIAARRPGALVRALKWARRNRAASAGMAAAALAIALAAGLLLAQARAARQRTAQDVRDALAEARGLLQAFRDNRARLAQVESSVARLREDLEYRYLGPEEDALLDRGEQQVDAALRERETALVQVLALLQRADGLDPGNEEARALRTELYLEKMQEAEVTRNARLADFYRGLAVGLDTDGTLARDLATRGEAAFDSEPPGAAVRIFRYRELSELVPDGEPRMVPVPIGAEGELALPISPGELCLRVVRGAGELAPGDLIVELAGHGIAGTMLAAPGAPPHLALRRLASIDGQPVSRPYDLARLEQAAVEGGTHVYEFAQGWGRLRLEGASLAALGVQVLPPEILAELGGVPALVLRDGRPEPVMLPEGLHVRPTAAALAVPDDALVLTTPTAPVQLEPGGYLALAEREGCEPLRFSFKVERTSSARHALRLDPLGTTPPGFVRVNDFWLQEREVTFAEYLEFLNDPDVSRAAQEAAGARLVPRETADREHCALGADGCWDVGGEVRPEWPVFGVSWLDATEYARWRTAKAQAQGAPFELALPTFEEWKAAGHGADGRIYVFGMRFRPKWVKSNYSRPEPDPEPVVSYPVDESVFGAYDMSGSVMEWLDDWYREGEEFRRAAGGSWGQTNPNSAFLVEGGLGVRTASVWNMVGFRLVARPRR